MTIVPLVKRIGARLIAMTGNPASPLARLADCHLDVGVEREACPLNLAPTASTTAAIAMGDALAVALLDARGFGEEDFASSHPGGTLGRKMLTRVVDVMRTGEQIPLVGPDTRLADALLEMTRKRMGMVLIVTEDRTLSGIFTDGDLRRLLERDHDIRSLSIGQVMTRNPAVIEPEALASSAARLMEDRRITQLAVVRTLPKADTQGLGLQLVGALQVHDLLSAKVA